MEYKYYDYHLNGWVDVLVAGVIVLLTIILMALFG
jgi:hypothetical protein